jgi:hypothetical protein
MLKYYINSMTERRSPATYEKPTRAQRREQRDWNKALTTKEMEHAINPPSSFGEILLVKFTDAVTTGATAVREFYQEERAEAKQRREIAVKNRQEKRAENKKTRVESKVKKQASKTRLNNLKKPEVRKEIREALIKRDKNEAAVRARTQRAFRFLDSKDFVVNPDGSVQLVKPQPHVVEIGAAGTAINPESIRDRERRILLEELGKVSAEELSRHARLLEGNRGEKIPHSTDEARDTNPMQQHAEELARRREEQEERQSPANDDLPFHRDDEDVIGLGFGGQHVQTKSGSPREERI